MYTSCIRYNPINFSCKFRNKNIVLYRRVIHRFRCTCANSDREAAGGNNIMFIKVGTICLQCLPAHASVRFFELTDDNSFVSSSEAREMTGDTAAAFVRNYSYKFIYCASLTFGTWMTADSNTPKVNSNAYFVFTI